LKVGFIPAKADAEKQANFIEKTLKPLMNRSKKGEISLFFADASHFVTGGYAGYLWGKVRQFILTGSGRKRFNVLGALNFATNKL
jgi:Tfp pilus tip-associated adhesin PilY1